jgi:hypothetical protein
VKPPTPVDPEKLPPTYHLTVVKDPEKGSRVRSLVATVMRGDQVLRRKVLISSEDKQDLVDELNRVATQAFYFDNPQQYFPEV